MDDALPRNSYTSRPATYEWMVKPDHPALVSGSSQTLIIPADWSSPFLTRYQSGPPLRPTLAQLQHLL
jgi:hypothetical protein